MSERRANIVDAAKELDIRAMLTRGRIHRRLWRVKLEVRFYLFNMLLQRKEKTR